MHEPHNAFLREPSAEPPLDSAPLSARPEPALRLPERSLGFTEVTVWQEGDFSVHSDSLAAEEPLEIRLCDPEGNARPLAVTMRTPGHDLELAAGFLLTEGIVDDPGELLSLRMAAPGDELPLSAARNRVIATVRAGIVESAPSRNFFASSSCGLCGKATLDALHRRSLRVPTTAMTVSAEQLCELPSRLHAAQTIFSRTGGLHASALFAASGEMLVLREDIGRHNAVDKVVGWAMQSGRLPLGESILLVSGRCGFEIAQKALAAGIPFVASISAPSTLAVQLAREFQMTLVGFLRERRFVVYSGGERCRG